ncbi:hypothetical protein [Paucisalibacillus sp. EB02]|uniref:hypothetical protein n=1 Tax=Paucisalibacillus sp. EB02 TaxID=1347087 RepID=UPI0004B43AA5|nr:hypothetical protein [Paucisalibacillus sp. EB02]
MMLADPRFTENPTWAVTSLEVVGTKQTVKVDGFGEYLSLYTKGSKSRGHVLFESDMDFGFIKDIVECVEIDREPAITGYDGLKALEVTLSAYEVGRKWVGACHFQIFIESC